MPCLFEDPDSPRRAAQIELSLAVVTEMSGRLVPAADRYRVLSADERLSPRDRQQGIALLDDAHATASHYGLAHQLASIDTIRRDADTAAATSR